MQVAQKLAERISLVPGNNQGKYPFSNSMIIEDDILVLIDPAADLEFFIELSKTRKVDLILLSHYHEDHFWFSYLFPEAEVWIPEQDAFALVSLDAFLDAYRLEGEWREDWRKMVSEHFHFRPLKPARLLKEGDRISFGKIEMQVLHTPGHTGGHSAFYFPAQGVVFLADIDLTKFGPWYGDRTSDIDDYIRSIRRAAELDCRTFVVSHEQPLYEGNIKKEAEQYLAVIEERENRLRGLLQQPRTMDDIVQARIIYRKPREPKSFFDFGEWAMMTKHLERMIKSGEVIQDSGKFRLAS